MSTVIAGSPPDSAIDNRLFLRMYRRMVMIRLFEEQVNDLYTRALMPGLAHLYIGEEAIAVGVCEALRADDYITSTHRGHGHCLAKGAAIDRMFAELLGKEAGYCKGKGGSMHIADPDTGNLGANAIVAGSAGIATGAAFSSKRLGNGRVTVCFFGEGAMGQGVVYEVMNMAALWKLPVIYVVENNLYAMGTSLARSSAVLDLTVRGATPYGIPGFSINGNDIELMAKTTREAVNRARTGEGPTFIEAQTYRYKGHSISDPGKYRLKDELDSAVRNDPIVVYQNILKQRGWIDQEAIDRMQDGVKQEIEESIAFAEQSEPTPLSALYEDITVAPYIPQE
jgi:pyruvate dehydrogenase E1 component subunit alpha